MEHSLDRATRDKFASSTDQTNVTAGNACWETPPAIYADLDSIFGFDIDLCADSQRALAEVWFGPGSGYSEDLLAADWWYYGATGFCNPPYGRFIGKVLEAAVLQAGRGFTSVHLLPLRLTKAMRWAIFGSGYVAEWWFPDKRITFYENGTPRLAPDKTGKLRPTSAMFDSTILVFKPTAYAKPRYQPFTPLIREYKVPKHV